jgi:quinol monooxygenase YgiN
MSSPIDWVFETAILPGQFEAFQALAAQLIEQTKAEPGVLVYEWCLSEDKMTCHVLESYKDSEAILVHLKAFGPFVEQLLKTSRPIRLTIHGEVSAEVKTALVPFAPEYYASTGGFRR